MTRRAPAPYAVAMTRGEFVRAVKTAVRRALRDDIAGKAAEIAYYFFLSLFPLVLVLFALTGLVGGNDTFVRIAATAERLVPPSAWRSFEKVLCCRLPQSIRRVAPIAITRRGPTLRAML